MRVNIVSSTGYTAEEIAKATEILNTAGDILSSDDFRNMVLDFHTPLYGNTFFYRPWQQHFTNQEVYDLIISATENPGNLSNGVMDLYLVMEDGGDGSVVGYGNPGETEIHTYRASFNDIDDSDYAAHIVHEWTHKLGFDHDFADMPKRKYSVPYGIQGIITKLYQ